MNEENFQMILRNDLLQYLDSILKPETFSDYCHNGLQVEGCEKINSIVTGVTACQALLDAASKKNADVVLVHHGLFWQNDAMRVVGIKHHRLKTLLEDDINLIAYHLPLDAQPDFGNNVLLAKMLGFNIDSKIIDKALVFFGHCEVPSSGENLKKQITKSLNREPLYIPGSSTEIKSIAWCSGGGQDYIENAAERGVDAYLTGEISERTVHIARETGMHLFGAGHHATERCGIKALGENIAKHFNLPVEFIDIDNPV